MDAKKKRQDREQSPSSVSSVRDRDREWEHRLLWVLVIAVLGLMTFFYLNSQVDRRLRAEIIKRVSQKFPGHIVELERAHLEEGRAVMLEGLRISLPTTEGVRPIFKSQRIVAHGKLELIQMLGGHIPITQVAVDGLELSIWPLDNDKWSIQTLMMPTNQPCSIPNIDIQSGLLRVGQNAINAEEIIAHDLKVRIRPIQESAPEKSSSGICDTQGLDVRLSMAAGYFRSFQAQANIDLTSLTWRVRGECKGLAMSDRLIAQLPPTISQKVQQLAGLRCEANAAFQAWKNPAEAVGYEVNGSFEKGRLEHARIPYLLESLKGQFAIKNDLLQLRQVEARNGQSMFWIEADINGFSPNSPMIVNAKTIDLQLDDRLFKALPPPLQEQWLKFLPSGSIDSTVQLRYDGTQWQPFAIIRSRDVSIEPEMFPMRVSQLNGNFVYENNTLTSEDLVAKVRGQTARGTIRLEKAAPRWAIDLRIATDGPVAIQEELIAALTPRNQPQTQLDKFVRSLHPSGTVHVERANFVRTKEDNAVLSKTIELSFYDGSIQYDGFRYPIFNVQGRVVVDNNLTLIQNLQGRNDSARIQCMGKCTSSGRGLQQLSLDFETYTVPLEEELRRALPAQMGILWDHVQPSGVLDRIAVKLRKDSQDQPMDLEVIVEEDGKSDLQAAQTVSIRPTAIPMLLDNITCSLVYRPGRLTAMHFSGSRDLSRVKAEGSCWIRSDGTWDGTLNWLPGTRLIIDQNLVSSLPGKLRYPLKAIDFHGPVNVIGWTHFIDDHTSEHPYANAWELRLDIEDGKLAQGQAIAGIRGAVYLEGETRADGPAVIGSFNIDSLALKGIPILGLTGPFAIADGQTYFGRESSNVTLDRKQPINVVDSELKFGTGIPAQLASVPNDLNRKLSLDTPRSPSFAGNENYLSVTPGLKQNSDITAQIAGGRMSLYGTGQSSTGRANLRVAMEDLSLKETLQELGQSGLTTTGKVNAQLQLSGSPANLNTISGGGEIQIREAKLYELPSMARLLRLLSIRPSDESAFESADLSFRIDGDRIPLERLSLDGDIISLRGSGWANLRRELHLDLYTYIGQKSRLATIFAPVLSHNDASFLYVEVDGTVDRFEIQKKLPMLETTLEQVFPEKAQLPTNERIIK